MGGPGWERNSQFEPRLSSRSPAQRPCGELRPTGWLERQRRVAGSSKREGKHPLDVFAARLTGWMSHVWCMKHKHTAITKVLIKFEDQIVIKRLSVRPSASWSYYITGCGGIAQRVPNGQSIRERVNTAGDTAPALPQTSVIRLWGGSTGIPVKDR
ncbi:hypothetical protein RRG08_038223 [Elysia crispata]|uniref:Uncharacterized protein n=1 Tax=Elysia crispata TaxID=231223 RepID=A0AAE1AMV3_9GAST|nr:hypothetical protein RRG08_038223 [Elysia crispata]